jgi:hypothetical protein
MTVSRRNFAAISVTACLAAVVACGASGSSNTHAPGDSPSGSEAGADTGPTLSSSNDAGSCAPGAPDLAGCTCAPPGASRACYTGPLATRGVGACHDGSQTCAMAGEFLEYGTCDGEALPSPEKGHCADGVDNDCNGLTDCQDPSCATDPACAPAVDSGSPVDSGSADSSVPFDAAEAAPGSCPTGPLARTVGAHPSILPSMVWTGDGYTIVIDEVVSQSPLTAQLTFEKTDSTGALLAGPTPITPSDGVSRFWPRVAFSGTQYGITFVQAETEIEFLRTDATLTPIPGSTVTLGPTNGLTGSTIGTAAVAWSGQTWGVAWSVSSNSVASTLYFERFDATGAPIGAAQTLGPYGLSDNGTPLIATSSGWAIVVSASPAVLLEIDPQGNVRTVTLPFDALRASLATNGALYGVVADAVNPTEGNSMFATVQVGGALVSSSVASLGTAQSSLPTVVWVDGSFLAVWSETYASDPLPLKMATIPASGGATAYPGTAFSTNTNAGFNNVGAGPCSWGVVYGTFTPGTLDELEVRP